MSSKYSDESFEQDEYKQDFALKFIQKIFQNGSLGSFIQEIDEKLQLKLLSSLGVEDAHAYQKNIKKLRIQAYVKSKNPTLLFKKNGLSNKESCHDLLMFWSFSAIMNAINSLKTEQKLDDEVSEHWDENFTITNRFIPSLKYFYEKNNLQKVCSLIAGYISCPAICFCVDQSDSDELIDTLGNPSNAFVESLLKKIIDQYESDTMNDELQTKMSNLKNQYASLSNKLIESANQVNEFGELPNNTVIESITELNESFQKLKRSILQYADQTGFHAEEENTYTTLNEIINLADKIQEFENIIQLDLVEKAEKILNQLKKIKIDGSQDDEKLVEFFHQIDKAKKTWIENEQIVKNLCSGQHPLAMFIEAIINKDYDIKSGSELQKSLTPYCGNDVAIYLMYKLWTKALTLNEVEENEDNSSESVSHEKQIEDIQSSNLPKGNEVQIDEIEKNEIIEDSLTKIEKNLDEISDRSDESKIFMKDDLEEPLKLIEKKQISDESIETPIREVESPPNVTITDTKKDRDSDEFFRKVDYVAVGNALDRSFRVEDIDFNPCLLDEAALDLTGQFELQIAYHVSKLTEDLYALSDERIPSWVIKAVVLGLNFTPGTDALILPFQESISFHNRKDLKQDTSWTKGLSLMLAGATFRSALFAPMSGAQAVLHELRFGKLNEVANIAQAIVKFANMGVPLPITAIQKAWTITEWEKEFQKIRDEAQSWLSQAGSFAIISRPGKAVWRYWISDNGPIYAIINPIIKGNKKHIQLLREKIARWPGEIENDAKSTHRRTLGHKGDLLRPALNQISRHSLEAISFVEKFIYLVENNIFSESSHNEKQILELRQNLDNHYESAMTELREIESSGASQPYIVGSKVCLKALSNLYSILKDLEEPCNSITNVNQLLNENLLRVPKITLNENWIPEEIPEKQLIAIMKQLADGLPDYMGAFETHCNLENHEATERIVQILRSKYSDDAFIEEIERKRDKLINKQRDALIRGVQKSQRQLSEGLNKGLLQGFEYEKWSAKLTAAEQKLKSRESNYLRFFEIRRIFESVYLQLETMKGKEEKRIQDSFSELDIREDQKQRIDKVLQIGDIYTANDYLERLRSGKELPDFEETSDRKTFLNLFDTSQGYSFFSTIEKNLSETKPSDIIDAIKNRRGFRGISMIGVPGTQARQSGKMMETWLTIKRNREISEKQAMDIFMELGFNPIQIEISNSGQRTWIELKSYPVFECPVSDYGSSVDFSYQILCEWGITNEEDLLGAFNNSFHGKARIVFYFGRMTETRRRHFGRLCRQRHQTVIVLDDTLLAYLCSFRGSKLKGFYECSLPFTYLSPYSITSSLLPPEMFYGRRRQIEALISDQPNGSCMLYGGRQVGKTVLLRHVERIFQNREKGFEAKFIDLKVKGIGTSRPLDDLWGVLAQELSDSELIMTKVPAQVSPDWLFNQIENWLNKANGRRILLLLDEADVFLESDGRDTSEGREPFSRCALIRGAMEKTNRRIKVVFSGLHNVQRSTEVANNPLAQFGETICIGPMLSNGESLEAERLITKPLSSLGYFFESPDLVARILAHTNYYPNLIQIYCHNLLAHLIDNGDGLFDQRNTPPFIITSAMIDDVYERHDLRESISNKFKLTLNLDLRFRLIAHILAYYDENNDEGFDVDWIRNETQEFWPTGFKISGDENTMLSYDAFKNLLDEMVGLGILRRTQKSGYYALRSPNVVNLLGYRNQIEEVLIESESWEPVGEYEPATFHAMLDDSNTIIRSPLTAEQEASLKSKENQVFLLQGNQSTGLDYVYPAILHRFGQEYVYAIKKVDSPESFGEILQKLVSRPREGTSVVYISSEIPWDSEWIKVAIKKAQRLRLKEATVTFLFVSDPLKLWQIIQEKDVLERNIQFLQLKPFSDRALRQWLEDGPFGPQHPDFRTQIKKATGNWPFILYQLANGATNSTHLSDVLSEFIENRKNKFEFRKELSDAFGLNIEYPVAVLKIFAMYGDNLTQDDLMAVIEDSEISDKEFVVSRTIKWAEALNLLGQTGVSHKDSFRKCPTWRLDPIVRDLLKNK
jgi:hypothetical protein